MSSSVQNIAARLVRLERQVNNRTPQLAHSSIEDSGSINSNASDGTTMAAYGGQFDGSFMAASLVGPTPPTPSDPIVTAAIGGLTVRWDGLFTDALFAPMDFARVEVHVSTDPAFIPDTAVTLATTIESPRGTEPFIALASGAYYVAFVARSLSGKAGLASTTTGPLSPQHSGAGSIIFTQATAPTSVGRTAGDMWIDTDDSNRIYVWDGAWTARLIGDDALANPIQQGFNGVSAGNFSVSTGAAKASLNIVVPMGYTRALVLVTVDASCKNTSATADILFVRATADIGVGGEAGVYVTPNGYGSASASAVQMPTGLVGGANLTCTVSCRTSTGAIWTASNMNMANVNAIALFLR